MTLRLLLWRSALVVLPGLLSAQSPRFRPDTAQSVAAERRVAMIEIAAGRVLSAVTHLERARALMEGQGRDDASVLLPLASAYARLGQTDLFVPIAERALRAGATGPDAEAIRSRLARVRSELGEIGTERGLAAGDRREVTMRDDAWRAYQTGKALEAAQTAARLATTAASPMRRGEARLLAGQAFLEGGAPDSARRWFTMARDSVRAWQATIDSAFDAGLLAPSRAVVGARAFELLYGDAASSGQLLVPDPDTIPGAVGAPPLRARTSDELAARERLLGPTLTPGFRTVLRLPFTPAGMGRLRALAVQLREADARVARAQQTLEQARQEQSTRRAAAEQLIAWVGAMRDSLALSERSIRALSDSMVRRDSSIARTVRQYRTTLLGKIAEVRKLAAANERHVDSLVSKSRDMTPTALGVARDEMTTAGSYLQIANAAEAALDSGLVRQPVLARRDSARAKLAALVAGLALEQARQDSARLAALALRDGVAAAWTAREKGLMATREAFAAARDSLEVVAAAAAAAELRERTAAWRTVLLRELEGARFGEASARFFALLPNTNAPAAPRDTAITALTAVVDEYPQSPMRPRALLQLSELLARAADAEYARAQRTEGNTMDRPDYTQAIGRLDEFLRLYSGDAEADAAAYTVGSLNFTAQKWDESAAAWERVIANEQSHFRSEAYYRLGETRFEQAIRLSGDARRALLAQAATAYEKAIDLSPRDGDVYYLAMYKMGWSSYVQAERQASDEYRRAVDVFARLVVEYDQLTKERQARLALREEAIDYMAIALTQIGGANDAIQYLTSLPDLQTRMLVLRRTARALREQGEFTSAGLAFRAVGDQSPLDTLALNAQAELVDLYQNRMLEQERAQQARLHLVDSYGPDTPWGRANPTRAAQAAELREHMLRDAAQYELARAAKGGRAVFASAADLLARYQREFSAADSAPRMNVLYAEALFGAGEFAKAGAEYSRAAVRGDTAMAAAARRNAIVALDSAFAHAPTDRAVQDSLFAASDRFAALAPEADARAALIAKGRRASEAGRWEVMASSFDAFATKWPAEPFATDARKLVGDARYKLGAYAVAQREWGTAQRMAAASGRKALADSIAGARIGAAAHVADSLTKAGEYAKATDEVYVPLAADIGDATRAGDALRNAIEVHLSADSLLRSKGDTVGARAAKRRAVALIQTLAQEYPTYQHTFTYRTVRARLLSEVGDAPAAVDALRELSAGNPAWPGRADAMVRTAVLLDSLGRRAEAAAAYEQVSVAYPQDKRAADAAYNAAVTFGDAKDAANSARVFASFVTRFPKDPRVVDAQRSRLDQLMIAGDSATAATELARLCVKPAAALADRCAARIAEAAYREGMALWPRYEATKLIIAARADLTRAGVDKASAPKQQMLRQLGQTFGRAIATGAPLWLSAASFQTGLAQWHYGLFLRDVQLPAELTEGQRTAAQRGSAQQAQQYFDAARVTWQALVEKAANGSFTNDFVARAKDALEGKGIPPRELAPPPDSTKAASDSSKTASDSTKTPVKPPADSVKSPVVPTAPSPAGAVTPPTAGAVKPPTAGGVTPPTAGAATPPTAGGAAKAPATQPATDSAKTGPPAPAATKRPPLAVTAPRDAVKFQGSL